MLGQPANSATIAGDFILHANSGYGLSSDIRQQLLQSLVYLPASIVGQADALESLKRNLQTDDSFDWQDFTQQLMQVWRYPVPAG
jgi:hypothetical protein